MGETIKPDHELVLEHEKLLKVHEGRLDRIEGEMLKMHGEFIKGLDRVDQSNKYLREQNNDILGAVIKRNETEEHNKHELQLINRSNLWKLIFGVSTATGLLSLVLDRLFDLIK